MNKSCCRRIGDTTYGVRYSVALSLTVNLFAPFAPGGTLAERYTLPIRLLALSMAMELGCESQSGFKLARPI